jgi:putative ABC transport system permease protein
MLSESRQAVRALWRTPSSSLAVITVLALGLGSAAAIFSVVNAALLRPLAGVADPDRLVLLQRMQDGQMLGNFGYPDYLDYTRQAHSLSGIAASGGMALNYIHGDVTERIRGALVSGNYFEVLGVTPTFGRLLEANDERNATDNAVLSYALWQRDFDSDPDVIHRTAEFNGHPFTIVGVTAKGFQGITIEASTDAWLSLTAQPVAPRYIQNRAAGWLTLFGRLAPGVQLVQARSELSSIASNLGREYATTNAHRTVQTFAELGMDPDTRNLLSRFLTLLLGAVLMLLMIACANVASLLLARGVAQRREIAVRLAIGASRRRLATQFLAQALTLTAAACIPGLTLSSNIARFIVKWQPSSYGLQNLDVSPDFRVLGFMAVIGLLTAALSTLTPIWHASKTDLVSGLKEGARGASRSLRAQNSLVVGQVAISAVLLIATGLVLRTTHHLLTGDQGFETSHVALFRIDLTTSNYSEEKGRTFYTQMLEGVRSVPGVVAASLGTTIPPDDLSQRSAVFYPGQQPADIQGHEFDAGNLRVDRNMVGPDFLKAMGMTLRSGRDFTVQDGPNAPPVAIVNERLAERLWPGKNAIGQQIAVPEFNGIANPVVEVVGVSRDSKYRSLIQPLEPVLYLPVFQRYGGRTILTVRTSVYPASILQPVTREIQSLDKNVAVYGVETIGEHIGQSLWQQQMAAGVIGILGLIATVLASVGLYGVVAQAVAQRTQEFGIRQALGARAIDISGMVLKQGFALFAGGIAIGIGGAAMATRYIGWMLYEISARDPITFAGVGAILAIIALVATGIPAGRAMRMNPADAFRYEK